jgi:DNA-binding GntR family transcriptional regulator
MSELWSDSSIWEPLVGIEQARLASATLREVVLQRVRTEIASGESRGHAVYTVPSLAAELGISTTPVREAMLELCRDGFLTALRNRGFRVRPLSIDELGNIFAVREVLEGHAMVALAKQKLIGSDGLHKQADEIAAAVRRNDVQGYLSKDRAFHRALIEQVNNSTLTDMIMTLRDGMRWYGIDTVAGRKCQIASLKQHHELVDLAAQGKAAEIAVLMSRHIQDWKALFAGVLSKSVSI